MNRRIKILFITDWYPSQDNPVRGIFVKEHAKAALLYNDIVVLFPRENQNSLEKDTIDQIEDGLRTIRMRYKIFRLPGFTYIGHIFRMAKKIKNLSKQGWKPDIIHANIHSAGLPSVILGKWFKVPVVITIHSSAFPRQLLAKIDKMLARIALNRVKLILPVSNRLLQSLKTYGIKNKFIILPNTYNPEIFYQQKTTNQFLNTKKILMVASLIPIKGIPYVLDAISKLKVKRTDFELDIISDGSYKTEYINLVKKYKIEKLVRFLGHKNKFEVADYMRKCQFFVLCSLWENLPCVLIEAMACGKPILATDVGGINELVNDNQGILIPSKDAKELERKIDFFLDNYQNYSAEKISKYASDNYSYNVIGKKLDGIYQQIMRENR